eukprot:748699-Hanusia_phi.AAC.2
MAGARHSHPQVRGVTERDRVNRQPGRPVVPMAAQLAGHFLFQRQRGVVGVADPVSLRGKERRGGKADAAHRLTTLDDGSLDPDTAFHASVCREYRNPNEPLPMQLAAHCPFVDTQTSWILTTDNHAVNPDYTTTRTPYGLGIEIVVLLDTR